MQRTFDRGGLRLTVLSDGPIELPGDSDFYTGEELSSAAATALANLNAQPATFAQNPLLVESPVSGRTLVDAGVGQHTLLDSPRFGPSSGRLADLLAEEGIDPASIDRVLITHLHPDHCWGLMRPDGTAAFPNAQLHLHADELAHWTRFDDIDSTTSSPTEIRRHVGALLAIQPYQDRLSTFTQAPQIAPDIQAIPRIGHTPGHTSYRFTTRAEDLLSWGDCFHHTTQVTHPAISARTDAGSGSYAQRTALLEELARSGSIVHAYHFPHPGIGTVASDGAGRHRWQPVTD